MRFALPKTIWVVLACMALVAQVVPRAWGGECDRGCCAAESGGCCSACPAAPAAPPCRCQLDARQDLPLAASSRTILDRDQFEQGAVVESVSLTPPPSGGARREALAAMLSAPIRPVRILYGVWRN